MASSTVLSVRRRTPILVAPAEHTPREQKSLSCMDNIDIVRSQVPNLFFFPYDQTAANASRNPAATICDAISKALVPYYPLAGRLREAEDGRQLVVDCTGEGVLFVEAETDTRLEQLGDLILPPFPYWKELLPDVDGSSGILHSPLLLIQVTHLACRGFIFGVLSNHAICDAIGLIQFLTAVGELARGAVGPSVVPVWQRDLLNTWRTRQPLSAATSLSRIYVKESPDEKAAHLMILEDEGRAIYKSFFIGLHEISYLRKQLPPLLQSSCSAFEILTACVWRCRTVALGPEPDRLLRIMFPVDIRARMRPPIPAGYYGNCLVSAAAVCTAADLCRNSLPYAVDLVHTAKLETTDESVRAQLEYLTANNPSTAIVWSFFVSNLMHMGFDRVDFGWGPPMYGGPANARANVSFFVPIRNREGRFEGMALEMRLPAPAMDQFAIEIKRMTTDQPWREDNQQHLDSKLEGLSKL